MALGSLRCIANVASGIFASRHPAFAPRRELMSPAFPISDMSRRITTGFVLTLPAICSGGQFRTATLVEGHPRQRVRRDRQSAVRTHALIATILVTSMQISGCPLTRLLDGSSFGPCLRSGHSQSLMAAMVTVAW
jgi:hypothetical protein